MTGLTFLPNCLDLFNFDFFTNLILGSSPQSQSGHKSAVSSWPDMTSAEVQTHIHWLSPARLGCPSCCKTSQSPATRALSFLNTRSMVLLCWKLKESLTLTKMSSCSSDHWNSLSCVSLLFLSSLSGLLRTFGGDLPQSHYLHWKWMWLAVIFWYRQFCVTVNPSWWELESS